MALTEPLEAAVVVTAQSAEAVMPKRLSLPSREPACSMGRAARAGFGWYSLYRATPRPMPKSASMQASSARLWRRSFT
ncbi:hypothetical protein D3C85_1817560 [compost metagenome]